MGILQERVLEWVAMLSSKRSSQPRDQTQVSCTAGGFFTVWATRNAQAYWSAQPIPSSGDLPDPGIEPGSPSLQVDSLPAELPGKPIYMQILLHKYVLHYYMDLWLADVKLYLDTELCGGQHT